MKTKSLKANYIYSLIRIVVSSLVGIIIISKANTSLGPITIGKVEYANTIINYFMMFASLGIPVYGIREIAKIRENNLKLSKLVIELLVILLITSLICYIILAFLIFYFNFFSNYKDILIIFSSMILLSNIGAEWFFQGTEDQLYITIRYVFIRLICVVLLYFFVNSSVDYINYAVIMVLYLCGSNIFNFYFIFKRIDFKKVDIKSLEYKKHLVPILTIFTAAVSVNLYLQLDTILISNFAGDIYLGYYSIANKLIRYVITFITVGGIVVLPRLSNLFEANKEEYFELLSKTFDFILLFSIPFSLYFFIFSNEIILTMGGKEFLEAVFTLKILSPLCIIIGIAYFIGYLVLIPQNKESIYTKSVLISAVFSVCINLIVIKNWQQNGAAIVQIFAELLGVFIMIFSARKNLKGININWFNIFKIFISAILGAVLLFFVRGVLEYNLLNFIYLTIFYFSLFFISLFLFKESIVMYIIGAIKSKVKN